jgi:hypothetical protein
VRSFVTTFSHVCALAATSFTSMRSSSRPPVFSRLLWHVTQYLLMAALVASVCVGGAVAGTAVVPANASSNVSQRDRANRPVISAVRVKYAPHRTRAGPEFSCPAVQPGLTDALSASR